MLKLPWSSARRGPLADHLEKGRQAEVLAERFLRSKGLRFIERNFRCRFGEIDLIMADQSTLVFIEVRSRTNSLFGSAARSVNFSKQRRVRSAAAIYMKDRRLGNANCRIDVIAMDGETPEYQLEWIRNAF